MKFSIPAASVLTGIQVTAAALEPRVLHFPTFKSSSLSSSQKRESLQGRANPFIANLENVQNLYAIQVQLGSPAQSLQLSLEIGNPDSWVPQVNSALCNSGSNAQGCSDYGAFDPQASTSIESVTGNSTFHIVYPDQTDISGTFFKDKMIINDVTINNIQFAVASSGTTDIPPFLGILGIGYDSLEINAAYAEYNGFLSTLVSDNLINTAALSVWLDDPSASNGNLLFGGVDSSKYIEPLIAFPMVPDSTGSTRYIQVALTGISFSSDGSSIDLTRSDYAQLAQIDPGVTVTYLPDDVYETIMTSLGANNNSYVPCSLGQDVTAKFTLNFNGPGGPAIDVSLANLLHPLNAGLCSVAIRPMSLANGFPLLGDSFMQSAYVVYDFTGKQLALAQSKSGGGSPNIKEIDSNGIPGASVMSTVVASLTAYTASAAVQTSISVPSFAFTQTSQTSSSPSAAATSSGASSSQSTGSTGTSTATGSTVATATSKAMAAPTMGPGKGLQKTLAGAAAVAVLPWLI